MDDIEQPGPPGPGDDPTPAGPPTDDPAAQAPPMAAPPPHWAPPPQDTPPRRLTRSDDNRVIAGVCAGLGRHLSIDANLVRVAFAVLSFTGGIGFLLYIAGWLALPSDSEPEAPGLTLLRRLGAGGWRAYLAVCLGAIAVAVLAGDLDPGHPGLIWGLILLGFGIALLIREGDAPQTPPPVPPPPGAPGPHWGGAPAPPAPAAPAAAAWQATAAPTWPPRRRRRRSRTARLTIAAALLVAAGAGLLGDAGVVDVSVQSVLALCLTVVGLGLVVGAFRTPPRSLIAVGLLLVPVVLAAGISDVPLRGGAGDRLWEPTTVSQLTGGYRLAAGQLTVDLTGVTFDSGPSSVTAEVGLGDLEVIVPDGLPLSVRGRVGAGDAHLLDRDQNGLDVDLSVETPGTVSVGRLTLDLHTGLGSIHVRRAATTVATPGAL